MRVLTRATAFGAYLGLMMQHIVEPDGANAPRTVKAFLTMLGRILDVMEAEGLTKAQARALDLQEHLVGPGCVDAQLLDLERSRLAVEHGCFHAAAR